MAELWPPSWYEEAMKDKVVDYLVNLRRRAEASGRRVDVKLALQEWAERAGVRITAEDIERVTGRKAGEV